MVAWVKKDIIQLPQEQAGLLDATKINLITASHPFPAAVEAKPSPISAAMMVASQVFLAPIQLAKPRDR
jgi:hypothetical protein